MKDIVISTERLCLKPLGSRYLETVNAYAMDYENTKYMCRLPNEDAEETIKFLADVEAEWAKENPEYFENGVGELGWIVNKKYWRNGLAYEAAVEDSFEYRYEMSV